MEKLLHEKLREHDDTNTGSWHTIRLFDNWELKLSKHGANSLADEIERYYIPRPRFENGEPLKYGDQIDYFGRAETVVSYLIAPDVREDVEYGARKPYVTLHLKCGASYNVPLDEPLKRPAKRIIGADSLEKLQDLINAIDNVHGASNEELHLQLDKAYSMCTAIIERK